MPKGGYQVSKQVREDIQNIEQIFYQLYDLTENRRAKQKIKQGLRVTQKYFTDIGGDKKWN